MEFLESQRAVCRALFSLGNDGVHIQYVIMHVEKQACYLSAMLHNVDPECSSSDVLSPCSRVPRCCCQALIAWAGLYYTADVVGNGGGGELPAVAQG